MQLVLCIDIQSEQVVHPKICKHNKVEKMQEIMREPINKKNKYEK